MKENGLLIIGGFIAIAFCTNVNARETPRVFIAEKIIKSGYITKVKINVDGQIMHIDLPGAGAMPGTFSVDNERWRDSTIVSFVLDSRGQIPSIAYFQRRGSGFCYMGNYSKLVFDRKSNLVVEPLHSRASEQVINRYHMRSCALHLHDKLSDKVVAPKDATGDVVLRSVTRLKGVDADRFKCEYSVEHGLTLDPDNCFRP